MGTSENIELAKDKRISSILTRLLSIAAEDYGPKVEPTKKNDGLDAIILTLTMFSDDLNLKEQRKEEHKKKLQEQQKKSLQAAKIRAKNRELKIISNYKSEFIANMSHELKTPLNSIQILSTLLAINNSNNLSEHQIECANAIHRAGKDLLTLINEILDLSTIEAGKMDIKQERVKLTDIAGYMKSRFLKVAMLEKIKFEVFITKGMGDIYTDPFRLKQILKSLVSNAIKFSTIHGKVNLNILPGDKGGKLNEHPARVSFEVIDNGSGISKDKHQYIFESFQQIDGSTTRKHKGAGLGLAISYKLAFLLGGEINLESEQGKGSKFTLTLPARN